MTRLKILAVMFASSAAAQLLVLNKEGNVAVVDPAMQKILGKGPTGDGPHEVVSTTNGKLAVASNYGTAQAPGHTLADGFVSLVGRNQAFRSIKSRRD